MPEPTLPVAPVTADDPVKKKKEEEKEKTDGKDALKGKDEKEGEGEELVRVDFVLPHAKSLINCVVRRRSSITQRARDACRTSKGLHMVELFSLNFALTTYSGVR